MIVGYCLQPTLTAECPTSAIEMAIEPLQSQRDRSKCAYSSLRPRSSIQLQRGEAKHYIYNSKAIVATLHDVNAYGHLLLTTDDGEPLSWQIKEIKFLL